MPVRVVGADEVVDALQRLADEAQSLDLTGAGDLVRAQLEAASPRLTGTLAASWQVVGEQGQAVIGSELVYASVQNYGSSHVQALHFAERAAELATDQAGELVGAEIDRLISRL